jgi:hypothetical protein
MDIRDHLTSARDDLTRIEALTRNLGEAPSIEEIEDVLRKRDTLVARMKHGEQQLSLRDTGWNTRVALDPVSKNLSEESRSILEHVADLDTRLSALIESRMHRVRHQLSSLYHASHAAISYTAHSGYRTAR